MVLIHFFYINIRAIEQMRTFRPDEHKGDRSVAPLVQFFELVHIGDTIQSMVQVYFDKELVGCSWRILMISNVTFFRPLI
jgi:hypothetical protein